MRGKLTLLVSIIIFPCAFLPLLSAHRHQEHLMALKLQGQEQVAVVLAARIETVLRQIWSKESTLAQAILIGSTDTPEQIRELLSEQVQGQPAMVSLSWFSPNGSLVASTSPWGQALAPLEPVQRARLSGLAEVSDVLVSPAGGELSVLLTRGIWWEGRLAGVMVAEVAADALRVRSSDQRLSVWTWTLIDRQYQMLTGNFPIPTGTPMMADHLARQRPIGAAVRGHFTGVRGERRFGVSVPVGAVGWAVTVSADQHELLMEVGRALELEVGAFLGLVLLALLAVGQLERQILTPAGQLEKAALSISGGNLGARVVPSSDDEIGTALAAFNQMADRIEDLERQRTRFLQVAAHELRNPMAGVKAIASLLIWKQQQGAPPTEIGQYLPTMEQEINRLSAHLDDILQAFSLQEGHLELNLERLDLAEVILAAAGHFAALGAADRVVLEQVRPGAAAVLGDRRRLEVVIRCLVSNGLKYSPCHEQVTISLQADDDWARITVRDRGIGIPAAETESVFTHFFRASNLAGRDPGGLGLGLYIAKEILLQHGGRIWAESAEDLGSTFCVELPRLEAKGRERDGTSADHRG